MENINGIIFPENELEKLISAHDGDMTLVYVYTKLHGTNPDSAARDLVMTRASIDAEIEKLGRLGLLDTTSNISAVQIKAQNKNVKSPKGDVAALEKPDELPQYTSNDIAVRANEDQGFAYAIEEAQRALGKTLSSSDMQVLFGIYDYLGLPTEVIMLLINFCIEKYEKSNGKGRRPTFRAIEKEAFRWYNRQLLTFEAADNYIANYNKNQDMSYKLASCVDIRGRELTQTEQKHISSWIDMGFDTDAVSIAYDRTITNTGKLSWAYINKILQSWDSKGIHTAAEIQEKDIPYSSRPKKSSTTVGNSSDPVERRKNYEKLKKMLEGK